MPVDLSVFVLAAPISSSVNPLFYVVLAVLLAVTVAIFRAVANRRNREGIQAAAAEVGAVTTDGAAASVTPPPFTAIVAPAPPFPESIARLRALLGEQSPEPKITRYTRPVLVADTHALTITQQKGGSFLTIPAVDVVSVMSGLSSFKPRGTLIATKYPSVHITVRRGELQDTIVLAPILGLYDKVSPAQADAIAAEIAQRLGVAAR